MNEQRKFLHRDENWSEGQHICLDSDKSEVIFLEQIVDDKDECISNVSKQVGAETWKSGVAELRSGKSSATFSGLTLTRLAGDQVRIAWTRQMTHDERCFPMGAELSVTDVLANLIID